MNSSDSKIEKIQERFFSEAPEWNQRIAEARLELLQLMDDFIKSNKSESFGATKAIKKFCNLFNRGLIGQEIKKKLRNKKLSKSKYYRWVQRYKHYGLSGLLDGYERGGPKIAPEIRQEIERLIWENHLFRYQDLFEDLSVLIGKEKIPHYSTIRRFAKSYKEENWAALVLHHEGKNGLRDRNMLPALGRMDENLRKPNEKWELDTTVADLFTGRKVEDVVLITKDGKRCKIIGVIDVFSRMAKFYLTEKETALVVGSAIKDRILAWGIPDEIVIDNGKPYKNNRVLHFLQDIEVSVHICIPGNPVEKPHVERVFRTLSEKLFRRLEGYSGNSVQTRPKEIKVKYKMAELQQIIDDYTLNRYAETVHGSTGQRPRERMQQPGFIPRTIPEKELSVLLMEEHTRTVRRCSIEYQGGKYFNPKLTEGQKVKIKINDFDASEVLVFTTGNKFIGIAEDPIEDLKDIPFTNTLEQTVSGTIEKNEVPTPGKRLIRNRQEMYLDIRKREFAGESIDDYDRRFLDEFFNSREYRMIGSLLESKLTAEAGR